MLEGTSGRTEVMGMLIVPEMEATRRLWIYCVVTRDNGLKYCRKASEISVTEKAPTHVARLGKVSYCFKCIGIAF